MQNEQEDVEETLDLPEVEEGKEDTTDWKAEAQALQKKAIKQRENTKTLKAKIKELTPAEKKVEANQAKSGELDYGQKAFLNSYGIKGSDEVALVKQWVSRTGDDLDTIVSDDIFTAKLTALREARESAKAIPQGTKRSTNTAKDSVDYWTDKYTTGLPLKDVPSEFRTQVLNRRIDKDKGTTGKFYNS